jgi:hypothetical protein
MRLERFRSGKGQAQPAHRFVELVSHRTPAKLTADTVALCVSGAPNINCAGTAALKAILLRGG